LYGDVFGLSIPAPPPDVRFFSFFFQKNK